MRVVELLPSDLRRYYFSCFSFSSQVLEGPNCAAEHQRLGLSLPSERRQGPAIGR